MEESASAIEDSRFGGGELHGIPASAVEDSMESSVGGEGLHGFPASAVKDPVQFRFGCEWNTLLGGFHGNTPRR